MTTHTQKLDRTQLPSTPTNDHSAREAPTDNAIADPAALRITHRLTDERPTELTRRSSLLKLGGLLGTVVGGGFFQSAFADNALAAQTEGFGSAAVASGAVTCVLSPEMTQGPYYVAGEKMRRNVTEGMAGTPLALHLTVLNAGTCEPIKGANVEIWHASPTGIYSGVQAENTVGKTYMRGVQQTDGNGLVIFDTLYPGWYMGRTVHIHVMVHLGGSIVHTGQLFFNDTLTDTVYKQAPYNSRPGRDTLNATDSIFRNGGSRSMLAMSKSASGYLGAITMGVHR